MSHDHVKQTECTSAKGKHDLLYCQKCDIVQCTHCKREWGVIQYIEKGWKDGQYTPFNEPYKFFCNNTEGGGGGGFARPITEHKFKHISG